MEKHVTKIYVDSPVFGPEDEEVYQYVDPDIDAFEVLPELRLKLEDTLLQIQTRKIDSLRRESDDSADSGRYEDMDERYAEDQSNRSKFAHKQSTEVQRRHHFVPSGANRTYKELHEEEEEERLEMERRNQSQRRQMEQNHIPQLDLIDSDDEKPTHQGCTDLEIDEGKNSNAYEKTAEMVWMANRKSLLAKGGAKGPGLNLETKMEKVPRSYEPETPASFHSEGRLTEFQYPLYPVANEGLYNPQTEYHLPEAPSNFYPSIASQIIPQDVRGFQPFQPYTIENLPPMAENDISFQQPLESAWVTNHDVTRYQQRRFCSESSLIKLLPPTGDLSKSKDFIKANKKDVINKERPKKLYGEMFSKRKKKENLETGPPLRRHSEEIQIREPVPTNTNQTNQFMSGGVFQQPLSLAIHQQPDAAASNRMSLPSNQLFPSYLMPLQSMAHPSVHPVEHQQHFSNPLVHPMQNQQRISIPLQIEGVSANQQQNVNVDINLRLVSPDQQIPHYPNTSRNTVQQPMLTGRQLAYNLGTSNGLPMSDNQPMVSFGVLPSHTMNPYAVLPPVGDSVMNQHPEVEHLPPLVDHKQGRSIKASPKGSYFEQLKKQNQPQQYKEYTLGDYRRLKKEIKTLNLGKLGPDLDTEERIEKLLKEKRKQQYSKRVEKRNRHQLALRSHRELAQDDHLQPEESTDRRTIALEYAKTVPKPRIARHEADVHLAMYERNRKAEQEALTDEIEELQLLKERHNLERKQLELIEMGVNTILVQNA